MLACGAACATVAAAKPAIANAIAVFFILMILLNVVIYFKLKQVSADVAENQHKGIVLPAILTCLI